DVVAACLGWGVRKRLEPAVGNGERTCRHLMVSRRLKTRPLSFVGTFFEQLRIRRPCPARKSTPVDAVTIGQFVDFPGRRQTFSQALGRQLFKVGELLFTL